MYEFGYPPRVRQMMITALQKHSQSLSYSNSERSSADDTVEMLKLAPYLEHHQRLILSEIEEMFSFYQSAACCPNDPDISGFEDAREKVIALVKMLGESFICVNCKDNGCTSKEYTFPLAEKGGESGEIFGLICTECATLDE